MVSFAILAITMIGAQAPTLDVGPDWQWDEVAGCALVQREAGSRNLIEVSRYPASDEVWLTIADSQLKVPSFTPLSQITVTLEPGGTSAADGRLSRETDRRAAAVAIGTTDPTFLQQFSQASAVIVSHEKIAPLRRTLRSPSAAARGLIQCEDAKLRGWGIDLAYWRGLREHPRPLKPLASLFSPDDYPPGYLLNGVQGEVVVRMIVGANGRVKDCVGLNRRVDRYFLQNVCGKLRNLARFQPAVDQQGRSVDAPYITAASFAYE